MAVAWALEEAVEGVVEARLLVAVGGRWWPLVAVVATGDISSGDDRGGGGKGGAGGGKGGAGGGWAVGGGSLLR